MATAGAKPSMIKLVSNAIVWLANGKSTITPGTHTTEQVSFSLYRCIQHTLLKTKQKLIFLYFILQVGSYINTKKSLPPSVLAASPDINVYFLNAHTSFTAADVAAIKVSFYFGHNTMY